MAEGGSIRGRELVEDRVGTPQGAVISPLLANLYLHYVFDSWIQHWRKHQATGDMVVVRYADDIVAGFENRADAERFLSEWKERMQKFGLELHPDKTRLIEFGRHASENRKRRGEDKPDTFDFLRVHAHVWADPEDRPVHRQAKEDP
jgi:RNA-directed DNA polymerase